MELLSLDKVEIEIAALRAAEVLRAGGVVLFPTDTLYGLAADAFSDEAVGKLYAIKGRDEKKPIHAIVSNTKMAGQYGVVSDAAKHLIEKLPKGKVTFIVAKNAGIQGGIANGLDTFGFRIPDSEFCTALSHAFEKPYTATSANKAGEKPLRVIPDILAQLGTNAGIDLVIDAGELSGSAPSSVVDVSSGEAKILRVGAVPEADIRRAL